MSKRFMTPASRVEVALALDNMTPTLVHVAAGLSRRTGMSLRLAHAVESFTRPMHPRALELSPSLKDIADAVNTGRVLKAESRLAEIASDLREELKTQGAEPQVETVVLAGDAALTLAADATLHQSSLILVGAGGAALSGMMRGLSTTLQLLAGDTAPVMLVNAESPPDLGKARLRVLIADDLSPEGQLTVLAGLDLARGLGATDVLHLHVNPVTPLSLEEAIRGARLDHQAPLHTDTQDVAHVLNERLREDLEHRAPERRALLEARDCTYATDVATGNVAEEIAHAAQAFEADIIVFGRHRFLRRQPLALGRVPYHAMLASRRTIMVV